MMRYNIGDSYLAKVVSIIDGDTIDVIELKYNETRRIRLRRVYVPEKGSVTNAMVVLFLTKNLSLKGKRVRCVIDEPPNHGRDVAYVYLDDFNVNQEIIDFMERQGMS